MTISRNSGIIILETKLTRPRVPRDLVARPRLLERLNAGLDGAMTLVIAPAGFGKTTLVSSWLQTANEGKNIALPATWLSLDEGDSERDVFLHYFIAALRVIFPEACPETLRLLHGRQEPPVRVLMNTLSNEIGNLPSRFIVVIDDLHAIRGQAMFEHLNEWLRHWPNQLHLVLLSRFNPPLPLASLRAKGLLTEIRASDLRFSQAEATAYFDHALKISPDDPAIILLQERLEGWIAGLKMASYSLGDRDSAQDLATVLLDQDIFIADYLADEVIASQPLHIQRFLLKTSILDQFCVSLAEMLMDDHDDCNVRDCMDHIESADLFLIPLDKQHEWYRYHHMFRDVLRHKLATTIPAPQFEEMHVRVAGWFMNHGQPDRAIHHALEANHLKLVALYMEQGLCDALNREDRSVLERWLRMLPGEFINESPELLVMRGFVHGMRWELGLLDQAAQRAKTLLDKGDLSERTQLLTGLIGVLQGQGFYHANQHEQVVNHLGEALAKLPAEWRYVRGVAGTYLGLSLYSSDRPEAAQQFLSGQYESYRDKSDSYALRLLLPMAMNDIQSGKYEYAERTSQIILQQAVDNHLPVMEGWGHYLLGFVNYEWNELEKAAGYFTQVTNLFYATQIAAARNGMIGLAYTLQALGRPAEAMQAIDKLSGIDLEARGYEQMDTTSARARLLLMRGSIEAAERWIHLDTSQLPDQSLIVWVEQPSLTKVRILLARNKGADTQMALQILDTIGELAERSANIRITIEVLALRALALLNQGDSAGARETLIRSVGLARRAPFTRLFVDLGSQMQVLLRQITGQSPVSRSVSRILAAFPGAEAGGGPAALTPHLPPATQSVNPDDDGLDERLTQRELEILLLMAEPISLKEIASRMNITYTTARRYTINIYGKFGVHSRWEAVNSAIRKGILAPR